MCWTEHVIFICSSFVFCSSVTVTESNGPSGRKRRCFIGCRQLNIQGRENCRDSSGRKAGGYMGRVTRACELPDQAERLRRADSRYQLTERTEKNLQRVKGDVLEFPQFPSHWLIQKSGGKDAPVETELTKEELLMNINFCSFFLLYLYKFQPFL